MTSETLHTCSYSCTRPACVLAQRNELRARLEDSQAAAKVFANLQQADEALMRLALEALEKWSWGGDPRSADDYIPALRERLEGKK